MESELVPRKIIVGLRKVTTIPVQQFLLGFGVPLLSFLCGSLRSFCRILPRGLRKKTFRIPKASELLTGT